MHLGNDDMENSDLSSVHLQRLSTSCCQGQNDDNDAGNYRDDDAGDYQSAEHEHGRVPVLVGGAGRPMAVLDETFQRVRLAFRRRHADSPQRI